MTATLNPLPIPPGYSRITDDAVQDGDLIAAFDESGSFCGWQTLAQAEAWDCDASEFALVVRRAE